MLATTGLVLADITDGSVRRWWGAHPLTTDTVAGLLVLAITFQVADQVVRRRQVRERSRAVAAQAAIVVGQAARTYRALSAVLDGSGDRGTAVDEVQTYMMMLLVSAPLLIDNRVARNFLEQAQHLAGEMARAMSARSKSPGAAGAAADRMGAAVEGLRAAAGPLLGPLSTDQLIAAGAGAAPSPAPDETPSAAATASAPPEPGGDPPGANGP
jgi:hypothetical protein